MDEFTRHEALDRTHLVRDMLYSFVINHTYYASDVNSDFNDAINKAFDALCDAYQLCNEESENE